MTEQTQNVIYRSALIYATKYGLPIIPSSQQKNPLIPNWQHNASTDPEVIKGWWTKWSNANVSMVTGSVSGIIVLDVDVKDGQPGFDSLRDLEMKHWDLPKTPTSLSPSGGQHFLFKYNGPPLGRRIKFLPGLDLMAENSQILLPPSIGKNGKKYTWEITGRIDEVDFAPLPTWLIGLVSSSSLSTNKEYASKESSFWRKLAMKGACEGERNQSVTQLAGHLLRHYVDPYLTLELIQTWNTSKNSPPLTEEEVVKTVNSIAGKECRRRKGVYRG